MKRINIIKYSSSVILALLAGIYVGCQPEEFGDGNGLGAPVTSDFEIKPIEGLNNQFIFKTTETKGLLAVHWDFGLGLGFQKGETTTDSLFYPDADVYSVKMLAVGSGGSTDTITHELKIPVSDPVSGNLVVGGKMNSDADSHWTRVSYSAGVTWTLAGGKMTAAGGNGGHQGIYQAIEVQANKKYKVDMFVSGKGATDTWFEVYVGTAVPKDGSDYNDGGKRMSLNTWGGCGKEKFAGQLVALSCDPKNATGIVEFEEAGTVYLVIRTGGSNLGDGGISIDNVEFRGIK